MIKLLVTRDEDFDTPWHKAAYYGRTVSLKVLAENLDILKTEMLDSNGHSLAMYAAANNQQKTLDWLLANNISLLEKSRNGNTALLLAAHNGRLSVIQWLLQNGASLG